MSNSIHSRHVSLAIPFAPVRALILAALVCLFLPLLAGCGLHPGGDAIAYLRDGALWLVNPDGSNARQIAAGPIAGFTWSPNHEWLAYRTIRGTPRGTPPTAPTPGSPLGQPDAPGNIIVVSTNGGAGVTITPDLANIARSTAWWDTDGNRLLYRQEPAPLDRTSLVSSYIVAQSDQPLGIASQYVYDAASLPTLAPNGQQVAEIDPSGDIHLGPPGKAGPVVAQHAILTWPQSSRPTRILWQPGHSAFLYASPADLWGFQGSAGSPNRGEALVLQSVTRGAKSARAVVAVPDDTLDVAFSPDGAHLVVHAPQRIAVVNVANPQSDASISWPENDPAAQAWASPNGRYLLIQDNQGLRLATLTTGKITTLLTYAKPLDDAIPQNPLWTPTDSSPWRPDSSGFVFASDIVARWMGQPLPHANGTSGAGLYAVSLTNGTPGTPSLLVHGAAGAIYAPSWSYLDPSAALLQAA